MVTPKKIPYGLPPKKENGPFLYSYVDTPPDGGCHTIFGMIRPDEYTCFRLERRFGLTWWLVGLKLTDDDKGQYWTEEQICELRDQNLYKFIEWAKSPWGSKITEVKALSTEFNIIDDICDLVRRMQSE